MGSADLSHPVLSTATTYENRTVLPARFNYHHIERNGVEITHLCLHQLAILLALVLLKVHQYYILPNYRYQYKKVHF